MSEIALKTRVPANRKIVITVPDDVATGEEVEVTVRTAGRGTNQRDRIVAALARIADDAHGPEPTKHELDRQIQAERESWE